MRKKARKGVVTEAKARILGVTILNTRLEYNITQEEIAQYLERSKSAISEAEHGRKKMQKTYDRILLAIDSIHQQSLAIGA